MTNSEEIFPLVVRDFNYEHFLPYNTHIGITKFSKIGEIRPLVSLTDEVNKRSNMASVLIFGFNSCDSMNFFPKSSTGNALKEKITAESLINTIFDTKTTVFPN